MLLVDLGPAERGWIPDRACDQQQLIRAATGTWAPRSLTFHSLVSFCFSLLSAFSPFPLFVCYFQSFLSTLFLLYLFSLLRYSVSLLCSLQERRSRKRCNLVLISYLAGDKQQSSKETTGILFEKCHRSFRTPIQSLQKNKSIAIFNRHQITTQGTTP